MTLETKELIKLMKRTSTKLIINTCNSRKNMLKHLDRKEEKSKFKNKKMKLKGKKKNLGKEKMKFYNID